MNLNTHYPISQNDRSLTPATKGNNQKILHNPAQRLDIGHKG